MRAARGLHPHAGMNARLPLLLLAAALAAACGSRANEDVRASVQGSHLVIENLSHADVHFQLIEPLMPFIPLSTPNNLLPDGKTLRLRIAPSQRGQKIDFNWWRPGKALDKGIRGPDRVRKIRVELRELDEPLPADEAYVRACIALASAQAGRNHDAAKAEEDCMAKADALCPATPEPCARELAAVRAALAAREDEQKASREAAAATASRDYVRSGALDGVARDAFLALRAGQVDRYLDALCEDTRRIHVGSFTRGLLQKTGQDFAQRKVELVRVASRDNDEVIFDAMESARPAGGGAAPPPFRIKATFRRENGKDCLLGVEEVR